MKSKASFFSFPILKENLKRFWPVSALYIFILALGGFLPLIMSSEYKSNWLYIVRLFLRQQHPANVIFLVSAPVFIVFLLFKFMQQSNSAAVIHALPFTRKQLLFSNYITGLLLLIVPIIINCVLLLAIKEPVYFGNPQVDIFTSSAIMNWAITSLVISLFVFSVAILACMITGSSLLQVVFGVGFLFLTPALFSIFTVYFDRFLFGFTVPDFLEEIIFSTSPIIYMLENDEISNKLIAIYIIIAIVILIISYLFYKARHLETATDSISFNFIKPIFKYMVAFCGMTILGLYFMELYGNQIFNMYLGFFLGSFIAYIIAEVVLQKTIWVFRNLKGYLIFLIIAFLFILTINTDLLGYEKRMPNLANVESVYVNMHQLNEEGITDSEHIKLAYDYHKSILDNKNLLEKDSLSLDSQNRKNYVSFTYRYEDGKEFKRSYRIMDDFVKNNPYMKKLYETEEYKNKFYVDIFSIDQDDLAYLNIRSNHLNSPDILIKDSDEIKELVTLFQQDLLTKTYEEYNNSHMSICTINLNYLSEDEKYSEKPIHALSLNYNYKKTVEWLENHGYLEELMLTSESIHYMTVEKITSENRYASSHVDVKSSPVDVKSTHADDRESLPLSTNKLLVITDKTKMNQILYTLEDSYFYDHYEVYVVLKDGQGSYYGYYSEKTVPDFIANYFNNESI